MPVCDCGPCDVRHTHLRCDKLRDTLSRGGPHRRHTSVSTRVSEAGLMMGRLGMSSDEEDTDTYTKTAAHKKDDALFGVVRGTSTFVVMVGVALSSLMAGVTLGAFGKIVIYDMGFPLVLTLSVFRDGPAMQFVPRVQNLSLTYNYSDPTLRKMTDTPSERNSKTWLQDVGFSKVPGKELTSGFFRMNAGNALDYTYTYEELKLIIDGEFHLTDGTGQKVVAKKGDLMYFPKGTKMIFNTSSTGLGYFCGQRVGQDAVTTPDASTAAAIASNPAMVHIPQITSRAIAKMTDGASQMNSQAWLEDFGFSKVPGKDMTVGLFRMNAGQPLDYTYDYEELKLVLEGEFHLSDGTGQKVVAKAGDLIHFPNGTHMTFDSPYTALGYYCGQRKGGSG